MKLSHILVRFLIHGKMDYLNLNFCNDDLKDALGGDGDPDGIKVHEHCDTDNLSIELWSYLKFKLQKCYRL